MNLMEAFQEASKVKAKQDEWCAIALRLNPVKLSKPQSSSSCAHLLKHHKEEDPNLQYFLHPNGHYPSSPKWDTLVALLRHQVGLHWHCYLSYDAETQLRIASEFNVSVKAFHHALDLHQTIPLLKQHQVGVAIFSDHWGYKAEAYTASVHAAKKFLKAGVPMAFKSDHPVQNARYLTYESSKSIQYGLKPQAWIQSITSVPATLLDLNHRIGKIQPGMDADIVLWNASPMAIGARPTRVYVDGNLAFHEKLESFEPTPPLFKTWALFPSIKKKYVLFKNAQIVYQNELKRNLQVLINPQGLLMCIREECPLDQGNTVVYDLKHAVITAPLVSAGTELGFTEISQEPITNEGKIVIDDMFIRASEGFLAGGKLEYAAVNQGVLHTISAPPVKCSASTLYLSSSGLFVLNKTVPTALQEPVAFHVPEHVGSHASFVSLLVKKVIMLNESSIPLVLKTDHASHMAVLLSLKKNIAPHMIWIFHGAGEAELILDLLEEAENVILLLTTSRCAPYNWSDRRCTLQLIPSLKKRKIPFILSTSPYSVSDARNLRFEAGWARRLANLSFVEMVNLVTVDVMKAFNLTKYTDPFKIGVEARFLIWNGDFGEIDTQLMYVIDGSTKDIVHVPKHL
ncbi:hypothetical protein HMI56_000844 [Coelomomyces lativittatus]|nr:hypothetical protein HMI56_000844 [Coelomomyces lativittatus]